MATYTDPTTIISTSKPDAVQAGPLILVLGGIIALVFAGFFFLQISSAKSEDTTVLAQIGTAQKNLDDLKPTAVQLASITAEAKGLHSIFDTQKRWPAVLDKFAERLEKDMAVTSLQMSDTGGVTLAGQVPDYETYAKVFQALTDAGGQTYFSSAKPAVVTKITTATGSYITFTFTLNLQPLVLNKGSLKEVKEVTK